ncbi:MAG: YraN family protein [Lachnospiraceae bacterium]
MEHNKRWVGAKYEEKAIDYLKQRGMTILEHNYRTKQGEIDIIGQQDEYLVFVEVKYRSSAKAGYPAEAVDYYKQRTICKVADYYRYTHGIGDASPIRYDVVGICGEEITWYQNAYYHVGR